MSTAVLIDTSYFIFHRYFATHRWYTIRNKHKDPNVAYDDPEFTTAFFRHFENDISTLYKRYKSDLWFMLDCPRSDIWRMSLYPMYKATRKHAQCFNGNIFPRAYEFIDGLRHSYPLKTVSHPRLEADDVCFICQRYFLETHKYSNIVVIANDNDYLQIVTDNVHVVNKEGKHIKERGSGDAANDVLKKILCGDKSDNIPPICSGVGPKTAEKIIAMTPDDRREWIAKKGGASQFELNTKLISFSMIPTEYVDEVLENLKTI